MAKERVHVLEEQKSRVVDAYETQLKVLTKTLDDAKQKTSESSEALKSSEERVKSLEEELGAANSELSQVRTELEEKNDKLRAMEEDAGAEFRGRIRLLDRKLADANSKVWRERERERERED